MDNITIRKAGVHDIPTISRLAHDIWPRTYQPVLTPDQIGYMLELMYSDDALTRQVMQHTFLLAQSDGLPVGFAGYGAQPEPGVYKLHKIYVQHHLQGKGVGSALIQYIVEALKDEHATALDLNVNRRNNARFFYERLGFVIIREEDIDIGNNYYMNDYVMRLQLNKD